MIGANPGGAFSGCNPAGAVGGAEFSTPGRCFDAVRRDDSWAGSIATTVPATMNPATTNIAVRDMAFPTNEIETEYRAASIGARDLAG
jgi:hypothetical protein